jgi:hypothetical protein
VRSTHGIFLQKNHFLFPFGQAKKGILPLRSGQREAGAKRNVVLASSADIFPAF